MSGNSQSSARRAVPLLSAVAVLLLAGCAGQHRDSITVGAVPDDYRTNHPIIISETDQTLDLAVGAGDRGATRKQRAALEGFLANYDREAAPVLTIMVPSGSANSLAASRAAQDFADVARREGVPRDRIAVSSYAAGSEEISAPVRLAFSAVRAHTDKCGRWPSDILQTSENKHYANFGCSYQNNLAAQIANPNDLLGPRKPAPIDATNRGAVIGEYQKAPPVFDPNIDY